MTPREVWSNEAQERYVLAIAPGRLARVRARSCERERCPFAVVGIATDDDRLEVRDPLFGNTPVDMDLETLLGKPPRMTREAARVRAAAARLPRRTGSSSARPCGACCCIPTVADKTFLVTIGDRSVGGLCARDPMVGPWQVPVADCATTLLSFDGYAGEAFAIGERAPIAVIDAPASGRMAVGEALTNLAAAPDRLALAREAVGQLDGGGRRARRGRGALRHRERRGARAVPEARDRDPGRQGLAVDAHDVGGGRRAARGARAAVARRLRLRALSRRARHLDAAAAQRPRPDASCCSSTSPPAARGSAGRSWRRSSARPGTRRPTSTTRSGSGRSTRRSRSCAPRAWCSPTTTARTAASSRRSPRWPSPGTRACDVDLAPLAGPRAAPPRVLATLFNEELGVVLQVKAAEREHVARHPRAPRPGALSPSAPRTTTTWCASAAATRAPRRAAQHAAAALVGDQLADADAARQPRVRARGVRPHPGRARPGPLAAAHASTRPRTWRAASSRAAPGRGSRCCASRASTATSRWRRPSTGPASTRSTCT